MTEDQFEAEGKVMAVQLIPLVEEAPLLVTLPATATKTPVVGLTVTELQDALTGNVRGVHVIPSVEEAAAVVNVPPPETATYRFWPVITVAVCSNPMFTFADGWTRGCVLTVPVVPPTPPFTKTRSVPAVVLVL